LTTRIQVDDLQARRAHRKEAGLKYTLLVWPAVDQSIRGFADPLGWGGPVLIRKSDYAAQISTPLAAMAGGLFLQCLCSLKTRKKNAVKSPLNPNLRRASWRHQKSFAGQASFKPKPRPRSVRA
jgi:hypothetical protein